MLLAPALSGPAFCGEIYDAGKNGDVAKVRAMIKGNPDLVVSKDNSGLTALHFASAFGPKDVAELLLAGKADVNARSGGFDVQTPLGLAVFWDRMDVVKLLRKHGGRE
jgi:hypothetical protein